MPRIAILLLLPILAASGGCKLVALFANPPMKDVVAEYPYLTDKRICIVVRADQEMEFEFPNLRWEVADHVRVALEANIEGVTVVEPRRVVDFQNSNPDWELMDPAVVGKRFRADRVLEIDLTQYTTREPESPHLYRGYITAALSIYNTEYPDSEPAYQAEVRTVYPPESAGDWGTTDRDVRAATMEAFAEQTTERFYDRRVKAN